MLDVTLSDEAETMVCHLVGELDAFTVPQFRAATTHVGETPAPVVIDLTDVGFVDTSGLAALIRLVRRCHDCGLRVTWCARASVSQALHNVGFDEIAPMAQTLREAQARVVAPCRA
jgi:anti-sigma B factor antagonist